MREVIEMCVFLSVYVLQNQVFLKLHVNKISVALIVRH